MSRGLPVALAVLLGLCGLSACGSTAGPSAAPAPKQAEDKPPAVVPIAVAPQPTPAPASLSRARHCVFRSRSLACAPSLTDAQRRKLDDRIDEMQQAVRSSQFRDVEALVELARLRLLRNSPTRDGQGELDAEEGRVSSRRALALKATPAARLVAALATAQHLPPGVMRGTTTRALSLQLISAARPAQGAAGPVTAAWRTLLGYQLLAQGRPEAAREAFAEAVRLRANAGLAWRGLATAAHNQSNFPLAIEGYRKAQQLGASDKLLDIVLYAAQRQSRRPPPRNLKPLMVLPTEVLAEPPTRPIACESAGRTKPLGDAFCAALDQLNAEPSGDNAMAVYGAFRDMTNLCRKHDPVCGRHIAQALALASHVLHTAGKTAKAISVVKVMKLHARNLPGAAELLPALNLRLGDMYEALGSTDIATRFYLKSAKQGGPRATAIAEKALALRVANATDSSLGAWSTRLLDDRSYPAAKRAVWAAVVIEYLFATGHTGFAASWQERYRALLEQHQLRVAVDGDGSTEGLPSCLPMLWCAHRELLRDESWSAAARR